MDYAYNTMIYIIKKQVERNKQKLILLKEVSIKKKQCVIP